MRRWFEMNDYFAYITEEHLEELEENGSTVVSPEPDVEVTLAKRGEEE